MVEFAQFHVIAVLFICFGSQVRSEASGHRYIVGDTIPFYANKVGPYSNPSETYAYFDLPFCLPDYVKEKKLDLGEMLNGDCLVSAPYKLQFLVEKDSQLLCRKRLNKEEVSLFQNVIQKDYYTEMYFDDLPVWSFIGTHYNHYGHQTDDSSKHKYFLFKHIRFEVSYNKDRVIGVNATTESLVELMENKEVDVEFTYTVKWKETHTPFVKRMEIYRDSSILSHYLTVHRSSIINSSATVLILVGCLLVFYMRILSKDISKYAPDADLADNQEEIGWKYIHGDVFRFPEQKSLFAAALGCGTQLLTIMLVIIILGLVGFFHPNDRGGVLNSLVIIYVITSVVAGYKSVSFYYQLEGTDWMRILLLTGVLFCGPLLLIFCFLNRIAFIYRVTAALPLAASVVISLLWTFVASPLLLLGGIAGRNSKSEFQAPCRTTKCPREVPKQRWYRGILPQMALAGILPFGVICIQLSYIFSSVWGYTVYTLYSILSILIMLLLIITALVSVALTYFQLAAEDHNWWWRSFFCGGSTGLFIYGYCFYYYFWRSKMNGLMQTSFFFGYMACVCYGVFLMLGTVGFHASLLFVRYLYGSIKCE